MKTKYILIGILQIAMLFGCERFIDIDPPEDKLVTKKVFETDETANSAIGGLYASMMGDMTFPLPYHIAVYCGLVSDELDCKITEISRLTAYQNSLNSKDSPTNVIWSKGYNFIYQANSIIEGISNSPGLSQRISKQLRGEALFMRAFWHFYLYNFYGNIPLIVSTDYSLNSKLERKNADVVYAQVVADLTEAKSLLSANYVGQNSITPVTERIRPNSYAAAALLSRVYLYQEKWALAESEASNILANSAVYSLESIGKVFKKDSKEAIWQLQMPTNSSGVTINSGIPTYEAPRFVLIAIPNATNSGSTLSSSLDALFTSNDLRKNNWIGSYTNAGTTYRFPLKYKTRTAITPTDENSVVFRLAEVLLIRAEARAYQDQIPTAVADLDAIRGRAGVSLISQTNPTISKSELIKIIADERQRELFTEWGHRWMDLKRTKQVNNVMSNVTPLKGGVWSPNWAIWPIPLNDIINNTKLVQNEGYN